MFIVGLGIRVAGKLFLLSLAGSSCGVDNSIADEDEDGREERYEEEGEDNA